MFFIRIEDISPIMDATFLFIDFIYVVADLDITEAGFSLMASNPFLRYTATLYISNDFCLNYSLMDEPHSASISLPSLRDAITVDGAAQFDTVAINLEDLDQLTLTFETLSEYLLVPHNNIAKN